MRLKYACRDAGQYGLNVPASDYADDGVRLVRTTDLASGDLAREGGIFVQEPVPASARLQENDLLLSRSGTIGRAFLVPEDAVGMTFAGFLVRFRARPGVDPRFLYYVTQGADFQGQVQADAITSTIQNFNADRYANVRISLPDLEAQRAIVAFLDDRCSRVDEVVRLRERQISDMHERLRLSTASTVISGGARDLSEESPLALLATPPQGWDVVPARYLVHVGTGSGDTQDALDEGFPFFVRSQTINAIGHYTHDCEAVMTSGDGAGVGKIFHHYSGKFTAHQRVYVMTDFRRVSGRWFYYAFSTLFPLVALDGSAKNTVDSVRRHMITTLPIPVPPDGEQARLCDEMDRAVASVSQVTNEMQAQVELLRERRRSLITAAVTGEFDVATAGGRGVVA